MEEKSSEEWRVIFLSKVSKATHRASKELALLLLKTALFNAKLRKHLLELVAVVRTQESQRSENSPETLSISVSQNRPGQKVDLSSDKWWAEITDDPTKWG